MQAKLPEDFIGHPVADAGEKDWSRRRTFSGVRARRVRMSPTRAAVKDFERISGGSSCHHSGSVLLWSRRQRPNMR
jgi:hypothetical protein